MEEEEPTPKRLFLFLTYGDFTVEYAVPTGFDSIPVFKLLIAEVQEDEADENFVEVEHISKGTNL